MFLIETNFHVKIIVLTDREKNAHKNNIVI